jgi:hypothetical protein
MMFILRVPSGKFLYPGRYLSTAEASAAPTRPTQEREMTNTLQVALRAALLTGAVALANPAFAAAGGAVGSPAGAGMSGSNTGSTTGSITSPATTASSAAMNSNTITADNSAGGSVESRADAAQQNAASALGNAAPTNGDVNTSGKVAGQGMNANAGASANATAH